MCARVLTVKKPSPRNPEMPGSPSPLSSFLLFLSLLFEQLPATADIQPVEG